MTVALIFLALIRFADALPSAEAPANIPVKAEPSQPDSTIPIDGYCGVNSLYVAASLVERSDIRLVDLINPHYIDTKEGSSVLGLLAAARDHNIGATAFSDLSMFDLFSIEQPMLLHVKAEYGRRDYTHWVTFAGWDDVGHCIIYDAQGVPTHQPPESVAALWDGIAILIGKDASAPLKTGGGRYLYLAFCLPAFAIVLASLFAAMRLISSQCIKVAMSFPMKLILGVASDAVALMLLTVALASVVRMPFPFIGAFYKPATEQILIASIDRSLPKMSQEQLAARSGAEGKMIVIDARWQKDYENEHIPASINVPPSTSAADILRIVQESDAASAVIYCQSKGCPYTGFVAGKLWSQGWRNCYVLEGGWNEWKKKHVATKGTK